MLEFESVRMRFPEDTNIIVGQTHFIKTAEDMYEAVVNTVPQAKFGLAFNESSGPCLTRAEGNDDELQSGAIANAQALFDLLRDRQSGGSHRGKDRTGTRCDGRD